MGLVDYSDSDADEAPKSKKRRVSNEGHAALPPLPARFRDLYSSTVRTSTQDDAALHGGRKRATPHVVGNWPTHVYLDWSPSPDQYQLLCRILDEVRKTSSAALDIQSLLENELGVQLPLHVSLSRPLTLKTEQKHDFARKVRSAVDESRVKAFDLQPRDLAWHANENGTRSFLVLRLQKPRGDELDVLLKTTNALAQTLDQPLLYASDRATDTNSFHISVAWSLRHPTTRGESEPHTLPAHWLERLRALRIGCAEVKVRVGQDVSAIRLQGGRTESVMARPPS